MTTIELGDIECVYRSGLGPDMTADTHIEPQGGPVTCVWFHARQSFPSSQRNCTLHALRTTAGTK